MFIDVFVFISGVCGSAFAFELRLLGLAVGPCVRPCGGPLHDENFDLAGLPAHRLILFRAVAPVASA